VGINTPIDVALTIDGDLLYAISGDDNAVTILDKLGSPLPIVPIGSEEPLNGETEIVVAGDDAWFALTNFGRRPCVGDLNCDGSVGFADINPFVDALVAASEYEANYPHCRRLNADCNHDGAVDFGDITPFVQMLIE